MWSHSVSTFVINKTLRHNKQHTSQIKLDRKKAYQASTVLCVWRWVLWSPKERGSMICWPPGGSAQCEHRRANPIATRSERSWIAPQRPLSTVVPWLIWERWSWQRIRVNGCSVLGCFSTRLLFADESFFWLFFCCRLMCGEEDPQQLKRVREICSCC